MYHFIFVPLTIGLSTLVAAMQPVWFVKKDPVYLRMTKFFGKLFLINFAVGVVTGIVLEFQFGMNWTAYSRFVGDVFGAPLAMAGLLAFFMESVFLGLWIFGLGQAFAAAVPKRFVIAGRVLLAASAWHLARRSDTALFHRVMRFGLTVTLSAGLATVLTEMGRQPWTVFGVLQTSQSESLGGSIVGDHFPDRVHPALRWAHGDHRRLMIHHIRAGAPEEPASAPDAGDPLPAFSY